MIQIFSSGGIEMKAEPVKLWASGLCTAAGSVIAGPVGAVIGNIVGGLLTNLLPGSTGVITPIITRLSSSAIEKSSKGLARYLSPAETQSINHDLQSAFRDAFLEALYDLGGPNCFPQPWKELHRDVPAALIFSNTDAGSKLWIGKNDLAGAICHCFTEMKKAIEEGKLLPMNPPDTLPSASVNLYLEAKEPQSLADVFFDQNIAPFLGTFGTLSSEVPDFEDHLRHHLLDRTLVHLGEFLKTRSPAWRAFNRFILEDLRDLVQDIGEGQSEIVEHLDAILDQPEMAGLAGLSDNLLDLLSMTGNIEKKVGEGFDTVLSRVVEQHKEILQQFNLLRITSNHIETKMDRVLHILEDGRFMIEGTPSISIDVPPTPGEPPFKGLQYYRESDAGLFFGREVLTARLITRIGECITTDGSGVHHRQGCFLGIVGASGSGKSSFVRAGLIPALKCEIPLVSGHPIQGSELWPVHIITPTSHPSESLAISMTREADSTAAIRQLMKDMSSDPSSLNLHVRKLLSQPKSGDLLVIVVDQFEELFTLCDDVSERKIFIDNLLTTASPELNGKTILIITLRADFYAHCAQFEALRLALESNQAFIGPMNQEELRRAIEEPARSGGWEFEPGLVNLFLRDIGNEPGALPLLSHALLETWKHRRGKTMTLESYAESGGVQGAIARTAETVFNQDLEPPQRTIARNIFLRLTDLGESTQETRRRASLAELIPHPQDAPQVEAVLKKLVDARLVTTGEGTVEVAHEALIREWPTLRQWLDENREGLRLHHQVNEAAQDWRRLQHDAGALYRGLRLSQALEWADKHDDQISQLEREFLIASRDMEAQMEVAREAQRQKDLINAQKLAQEAEARRMAEENRAREAELSAIKLRNRNRVISIAGTIAGLAAILAICLALVAGYFSYRSNVNEKAAELQSKISFIRELSFRSMSLLEGDQDIGVLLAGQAVNIAESLKDVTVPEAQTSLYHALEVANFTTVLRGHTDVVRTATFNADGTLIVTASRDGTAQVWSIDGRQLAVLKGHNDQVFSAVFSPDGSKIVTTSYDHTARIWKPDGTPLAVLQGHTAAVTTAMFSFDGAKILTASADGTVRIWTSDGEPIASLEGHEGPVTWATFSPDGSRVLTTSVDQTARLWKTDGSLIAIMQGHTNWVISASYSPDGSKIATASWDGTARLWDKDGHLLREFIGHTSSVNSVSFSPDGNLIVTASWDNTARVWNTDGTLLSVLAGHTGPVTMASFSPDGDKILTASYDHTARLWHPDGSLIGVLRGHADWLTTAIFSRDGTKIITASYDFTARLWELKNIHADSLQGHTGSVSSVNFSPDGSKIMSTGSDGTIRLWRPDGTFIQAYQSFDGPIHMGNYSPSGKWIITANENGTATIWGTDGTPLKKLEGHTEAVNSARFSQDEQFILTGSKDDTVRLWRSDGSFILELKGHTDTVNDASFSPDGSLIVSASDDQTARVWKSDGTYLLTLNGHHAMVNSAVFSPDGKRILTGGWDGSAILWTVNGEYITALKAHTGPVTSAYFSKDGKMIVTTSEDGTAALWQADGSFIASLQGHTGWVVSASFSPDGQKIVTSSLDGTARLWGVHGNVDAMLLEAESRVGRKMTDVECYQYLPQDQCP
jgi:WD40 repeat protein/ABC-type oligopeptide transport system ATPase subunit